MLVTMETRRSEDLGVDHRLVNLLICTCEKVLAVLAFQQGLAVWTDCFLTPLFLCCFKILQQW